MIKDQSELIDRMYEIIGEERKTYSPVQWEKELGTYEPNCLYPQYFFEAYPPFTVGKQKEVMEILLKENMIENITDGKSEEITVNGRPLPDGLAEIVVNLYKTDKEELKQQIKEILEK